MLSCDLTLYNFIHGLTVRHSRNVCEMHWAAQLLAGRAGLVPRGGWTSAEVALQDPPSLPCPAGMHKLPPGKYKWHLTWPFRYSLGMGTQPSWTIPISRNFFCQSFCFLLQCLPCVTSVHYILLYRVSFLSVVCNFFLKQTFRSCCCK